MLNVLNLYKILYLYLCFVKILKKYLIKLLNYKDKIKVNVKNDNK